MAELGLRVMDVAYTMKQIYGEDFGVRCDFDSFNNMYRAYSYHFVKFICSHVQLTRKTSLPILLKAIEEGRRDMISLMEGDIPTSPSFIAFALQNEEMRHHFDDIIMGLGLILYRKEAQRREQLKNDRKRMKARRRAVLKRRFAKSWLWLQNPKKVKTKLKQNLGLKKKRFIVKFVRG